MELKRVVITGIGAVSPLGGDCESLRTGLAEGRSAVVSMRDVWVKYKNLKSRVAAPAPLLNEREVPRQNRRSMSRMSLFAYQAAKQALGDAFGDAAAGPERFGEGRLGCIIGSTTGSPIALNETFEIMIPAYDLSMLPAIKFFQCVSHTAAMNVAQCLGLTGVVLATSAACASGLQAVGAAYDAIRLGTQDAVLCGGAEELHASVTGSFDIMFVASSRYNDSPSRTPRPFDRDRDGLVCGEGAGILLLEEYGHARARNAKIYGEIVGYNTCGGGGHVSQSSRSSLVTCMRNALGNAGVRPEEIDYINAHAAGTPQGDAEEAAAIGELFGCETPVSSLKGNLGHTLGASGAIELIATLLMMRDAVLYPTHNLENPDCSGIRCITEPLERGIATFVKNSFAFGGVNSALVCRKVLS
jgi:3-oxoacyl-[acyl-carrier-protein] synthase II